MTIHKEGLSTIFLALMLGLAINIPLWLLLGPGWVRWAIILSYFITLMFIIRFFRFPSRVKEIDESVITSPADGKIISISEEFETEYFNEKRIRVSVFMSGFNVHANWMPVSGTVLYTKYHPGRNLLAVHPKSSELNERTSVVIRLNNGREILVRQIAGIFARRVVTYARQGICMNQGDELGFIKFGSRLDIFLPEEARLLVDIGNKVKGKTSEIAEWQEL